MIQISDGKVIIDVELNDSGVNRDVGDIDKSISGLAGSGEKASVGIGKIAASLGLVKLASSAINVLKSSLDGAISRYDTMNNFPKVMKQLGFSTEESAKAVDKLSDGVTGLPTPLNEIVSSAQGLAVMTGDLDGATDTALALNNAFLASGASSGDASRGLDQYVQMLSKGEVDMQSWRTLQETMGLALNETAKSFGFAGKSAQNDLYAALQDGSITFEEFNDKLIELDGGVDGFAERAKTASGGIATAFANMKTAVVRGMEGIIRSIDDSLAAVNLPSIQQMIENFGKGFEKALKGVAKAIPPIIKFIAKMISVLKPFAPIIMGVVAALLTFATGISVINGVSKAVKSLKLAFTVLKAAMVANPILLIVAALIGLGVALYTAYKKSETFRNAVDKLFEAFKNNKVIKEVISAVENLVDRFKKASSSVDFMKIAMDVLQGVLTGLAVPFGLIIGLVAKIADSFNGGTVQEGVSSLVTSFGDLATNVREKGLEVGLSVGEMLQGILLAIAGALPGVVSGALSIIAGFLLGLAEGLPQVILAGANLIISFITGLTTAIPSIVVAITLLFVTLLNSIAENLPSVIAAGVNLLVSFLKGITDNLPKLSATVTTLITTFLNTLSENLPRIISSGANLLVKFLNGIADNLPRVITAAVNVIVAFLNGIANNLPRIISSAVNLIVAFLRGIASQIGRIVSAAMDLVDAMVRGILQAQSRLTQAIVTLMNGMARNIRQSAPQMKSAAGNLLRAIIEAFPGGALVTAGFDLMSGLAKGIGNAVGGVIAKAKEVAGNIVGAVKGAFKIKSPSRVMRDEVGKFIPQGIAVGIDADADQAVKAMKNMNNQLLSTNIGAESALGIGGRMSTSKSGISSSSITNNSYSNENGNSEVVSLLREIVAKPFVANMDGRRISKALGREVDQTQGERIKRSNWGLEIDG